MLLHNLKIAVRNLMKYRLQTLISILSLAVGMVCFSLSALWLHYEKSYDTHWPEAENIYLVQSYDNGDVYSERDRERPEQNYLAGERLHREFPEIEAFCRMGSRKQKRTFGEEENVGLAVDSLFCGFFGIKSLEGRRNIHLAEDEIALSQSMAKKYFPDGNAIGQHMKEKLRSGEELEFTVVAVVEDSNLPSNEINYDFLIGLEKQYVEMEVCVWLVTYIRVKPEHIAQLEEKLKTFSLLSRDEESVQTVLIPLTGARSKGSNKLGVVRWEYLRLFMLLGGIVIGCGLFNYLSMLITQVRIRRRELLLRYVHGAHRRQLVSLVLVETGIVLLLSVLLAGTCIYYFTEDFIQMSHIQEDGLLARSFALYVSLVCVLSMAATAIIVWLSSHRQLNQQLGKVTLTPQTSWGHHINILVQLTVSLVTLFCAFTMQRQINYLLFSTDMGFTRHNLGIIDYTPFPEPAFEAEVRAMPEIDVLFYGEYPLTDHGLYLNQANLFVDEEQNYYHQGTYINEEYARAIGMQLVEGEMLQEGDEDKMLITEAAVRRLGIENPVGKTITQYRYLNGPQYIPITIKGIVRDMYSLSPLLPPDALVFSLQPSFDSEEWKKATQYNHADYVFRYKEGTDWDALCAKLEPILKKYGYTESHILNIENDYKEKNFVSEHILGLVLNIVTIVSILISVFGIFSTLSLTLQRRRKEIALRKIHGAKVRDIFRLFLSEYVWLLLGAAVVAFPVGFYLMHQWLSQYTRQVPFAWWLCPSILLGMAALILLTVFWQIWRAAKANAAEVIKE